MRLDLNLLSSLQNHRSVPSAALLHQVCSLFCAFFEALNMFDNIPDLGQR
jgi:hypothetical protein